MSFISTYNFYLIATLLAFDMMCVAALGQESQALRIAELNTTANWVVLGEDADGYPFSVDTRMMDRIEDAVLFRIKAEKRGTAIYWGYIGDCGKDFITVLNAFAVFPGSPDLVPQDYGKNAMTVKKGSVGSVMLDYVCEHAKITVLDRRIRLERTTKLGSEDHTSDSTGTFATPPPPPIRPPPKTVSGGILNGKALYLPLPKYPPAARAAKASGAVSVHILIDEAGKIISAQAVSGHSLLQAAAVSAAQHARFGPTVINGAPVKVSGVITYNFHL